MLKQRIRKERGITLVALIITIIVLIILAAVTIKIAFDSNFLKVATEGAENYAKAQEYEEELMKNLSDFAEGVVSNITSGGGRTEPVNPPAPPEPELPTGWDKDKVDLYEDGEYDVPLPKGFVVSKADGEKSVNDGLVIYQGTEDVTNENVAEARTSRNQFVWVPVEDPSEMFGTDADGNSLGKLYDFGSYNSPKNPPVALNWTETDGVMKWTSSTEHREPDVVTSYDNTASNYTNAGIKDKHGNEITNATQFKAQLQEEFEKMRESVEKYNGFYIGRYETGNLSQTKAVVTKGNNDISNQRWYVQYQKNKSIAEETNTTSSMIWGCQWDATMRWFLKDISAAGFVTNANNNGNWFSNIEDSGSSDNYRIKNIYDMAGNIFDWTIEAHSTGCRVSLGGGFGNRSTSSRFAAYHNTGNTLDTRYSIAEMGSRAMLVI